MNCPNCAAPLTPVPGRSYLMCEHCATFHHPSPPDASVDRIVNLGESAGLQCPICAQELIRGSAEGYATLQCPQCAGLLLTLDDFAMVVRTRRAQCERPSVSSSPLNPEDLKRQVDCPMCRMPMETHPYYGPGNQVIDSCARCKVLWLDCGELTAIERAPGRTW